MMVLVKGKLSRDVRLSIDSLEFSKGIYSPNLHEVVVIYGL